METDVEIIDATLENIKDNVISRVMYLAEQNDTPLSNTDLYQNNVYFEDLINGKGIVLLAMVSNEIVGVIFGRINESEYVLPHTGICRKYKTLFVENLSVIHSYHRKHIGQKLLTAFEIKGKEQEINTIALDVEITNDAAKGLYEKLGYCVVNVLENREKRINY
jgi:ribosomal protein S18 acetylase RimI-like enzyme